MKLTKIARELPLTDLTMRIVPEDEKFNIIPHRLFYYLTPKDTWRRCDQGRYNLMAANGYYVSYVDNAKPVID